MDDAKRGVYEKFRVARTDCTDGPGGKHERCSYFVLDLVHDPFAADALAAYADACEAEYPLLARDLRKWVRSTEKADFLLTTPRATDLSEPRPGVNRGRHL